MAMALVGKNPLCKPLIYYGPTFSPFSLKSQNISSLKPKRSLLYRRVSGGLLCNFKSIRFYPHLALKPTATHHLSAEESEENLWDIFVTKVFVALKALKKPAIAALLVGVILAADPLGAFAASGGRMGGRDFSSSSSPSYSTIYSVPADSGLSLSVPYYAPSPLGSASGFYAAPAIGVGLGVDSGLVSLLTGFAAFVFLSGLLSDRVNDDGCLISMQKTSVLKLQVGLLGIARSLQKDLDRIAETADTSTSEGLSYVLTETALALLRHPGCCISACSSVEVQQSVEDGEKRFNQLSIEERGKFDEETLVNVNNVKRQRITSCGSKSFNNECIVVTILVATDGAHQQPIINSIVDLTASLQKLGSIPATKIMAVEVLWTPQKENDALSECQLLADYPLLRPL